MPEAAGPGGPGGPCPPPFDFADIEKGTEVEIYILLAVAPTDFWILRRL